jgi:hypothetical protein
MKRESQNVVFWSWQSDSAQLTTALLVLIDECESSNLLQ